MWPSFGIQTRIPKSKGVIHGEPPTGQRGDPSPIHAADLMLSLLLDWISPGALAPHRVPLREALGTRPAWHTAVPGSLHSWPGRAHCFSHPALSPW